MTSKTQKCAIEACDRDMQCPQSGLCKRCYSSMWYWKRKPVAAILQRAGRLRLFMSRMQALEPNVVPMRNRKPEVVPMRTKRRASR